MTFMMPHTRKYIPSPTLKLGVCDPANAAVTPLLKSAAGAKEAAMPKDGVFMMA